MRQLVNDRHGHSLLRRITVIAASIVAGTLSTSVNTKFAVADLLRCDVPDSTVYNVFVDDIRDIDSTSSAASQTRKALSQAITSSFATPSKSIETSLNLTTCSGRFPKPSEFTANVVGPLDNRKVVLEVWGTVQGLGDTLQTSIRVVVIPARVRYLAVHQPPPGMLEFRHEVSVKSQDRFSPLLQNQDELRAYAEIAAGLKAVGERDYVTANSFLCGGEAKLKRAASSSADPTVQGFLAYAHSVGDQNFRDAQATDVAPNRLKLFGLAKLGMRCGRDVGGG